jgi:hypothetical protein
MSWEETTMTENEITSAAAAAIEKPASPEVPVVYSNSCKLD